MLLRKITKEDLKKYFAEIREAHYKKVKAEQERLIKLEKLRLAALNKDKKITLGGGRMSMSMFRNIMKNDPPENPI